MVSASWGILSFFHKLQAILIQHATWKTQMPNAVTPILPKLAFTSAIVRVASVSLLIERCGGR